MRTLRPELLTNTRLRQLRRTARLQAKADHCNFLRRCPWPSAGRVAEEARYGHIDTDDFLPDDFHLLEEEWQLRDALNLTQDGDYRRLLPA